MQRWSQVSLCKLVCYDSFADGWTFTLAQLVTGPMLFSTSFHDPEWFIVSVYAASCLFFFFFSVILGPYCCAGLHVHFVSSLDFCKSLASPLPFFCLYVFIEHGRFFLLHVFSLLLYIMFSFGSFFSVIVKFSP